MHAIMVAGLRAGNHHTQGSDEQMGPNWKGSHLTWLNGKWSCCTMPLNQLSFWLLHFCLSCTHLCSPLLCWFRCSSDPKWGYFSSLCEEKGFCFRQRDKQIVWEWKRGSQELSGFQFSLYRTCSHDPTCSSQFWQFKALSIDMSKKIKFLISNRPEETESTHLPIPPTLQVALGS